MEKIDSRVALDLLFKDVINEIGDISLDENRWVKHCIYVGIAAGRIARAINNNSGNYKYFKDYISEYGFLDEDYAIALGYLHDIGRKINHQLHTTEGYKYLCDLGYDEAAKVTLTHSFIDNDINNSADAVIDKDRYNFINSYLHNIELTPYDNIIQLCDLFCLDTGFTTVERRMLDIVSRKGVYENSLRHLNKTMELLSRFELDADYKEIMARQMGVDLECFNFYSIFPEISESVLMEAFQDYQKLVKLIESQQVAKEGASLILK